MIINSNWVQLSVKGPRPLIDKDYILQIDKTSCLKVQAKWSDFPADSNYRCCIQIFKI